MTPAQVPPPKKVTYNDESHAYYMDGIRAASVSGIAKIPTETFTLEQWSKRMVALGMAVDPTLCERIAVDPENKVLGDNVAADALTAAKAHDKAARGTQMHKVLELVLLNQDHRLMTEQQQRDAVLLRRTLDRYDLEPFDGMAEQFVAWPAQRVGGRFDAVLRQRKTGRKVLTDLKSGPNAVLYPHATAIQLALYARAPWISDGITIDHGKTGDKAVITTWRHMPDDLDRDHGFVLLCEPDADVGTLHEIDIRHGWEGARIALDAIMWRRKKDLTREVMWQDPPTAVPLTPDATVTYTHCDLVDMATTVGELRQIWTSAHEMGVLDPGLKIAILAREEQLRVTTA